MQSKPPNSRGLRISWRISAIGVVAFIITALSLYHSSFKSLLHPRSSWHAKHQLQNTTAAASQDISGWDKPAGLKVIGLVFYGRRRFVEILQCYLHENLVDNGGILDEVVFQAKTDDLEDLAYLSKLLATSPRFRAEYPKQRDMDFSGMYSPCVTGTMCVKIDDDVVFIGDNTIRSMVKKKLEYPDYLAVSANLVNNFGTTWLHNHFHAIHPYLPDLSSPQQKTAWWQVSNLPVWDGPSDWDYGSFDSKPGHRWLPLPDGHPLRLRTPVEKSEYTGFGRAEWNTWQLAAQLHYSFLQNLENEELGRYHFDTWNLMYQRMGINMFAISGEDIVKIGEMPADDEKFLTTEYPKTIGRPFVIDGRGIAVHHAHMWMTKQSDSDLRLEGTDILHRYRLYASQKVCREWGGS